jgi:lysozyme family protein
MSVLNLPAFFLRLMTFVFHWEGFDKFTGGKNDKGGATKFGVSLRFLKGLPLAEADVDGDGVVTWKDVYALTEEKALALFWRYFAQPLFIGAWPFELAAVMLDAGVNCGRGAAAKWAQRAFNECAPALGLTIPPLLADGALGQKSRAALASACRVPGGPQALAAVVMRSRREHYERLNASGDPDYTANFVGWMRRWHSLNAFVAGQPWRMEDKPWERARAA